jgi:hypothetical protein
MAIERQDIIGRRIIHILGRLKMVDEIACEDHIVELDSGALVNFTDGKLEIANLPSYPRFREAAPDWSWGAPRQPGAAPPPCEWCRIQGVLYSRVPYIDTGEFHRQRTYLLLDDGRYLTSGVVFNFTGLEADSFACWHPANKRAQMLYDHWTDQSVNPFRDDAQWGDWDGRTLIGPAPGDGG